MQTRRIEPQPGQESVWDYPRPPAVEPSDEHVLIELGGAVVAETRSAIRVLETSHPPTYYLPRTAFADGALEPAPGSSWCEFKGRAAYLTVVGGDERAEAAAWTYPSPSPGFEALQGHVAVYPGRMGRVTVDGEQVTPQEGGFYGGWVTSRVVGPFKGAPGTSGW
ncbi:DUF427 domain-containing protein [Motilibacter deserti]|uniref:DUF427 domain-containing protein n=1 Tax=Motilibacter deserti TaxID=2714956 RepID=A0ABX0GUZ6_9ACTN|nr:DUF427 domain-containing protein [Motilibacter deserti]NHC13113.1 DUF427 domain-containing protein [Motilibacter deserti]